MKKLIIPLLFLTLCTSCKTEQGRLSIVDLDFRKPAQIEAGARESEAPFKDWSVEQKEETKPSMKAESLPITWWTALFDMITKLECRLTLFQVEWRKQNEIKY